MRKPLWAALAAALLLAAGTTSPAQDASSAGAKSPVVTVSFAGYDQFVANLNVVGKLADRPGLSAMLEGGLALVTQGKGLAGLDKARPWVVQLFLSNAGEPSVYGFVPVSDLKELMALVPDPATNKPRAPDAEGVFEVETPQKNAYIAQKDKWAVIADSREALKSAPADPVAAAGDMTKKYLLAVKASVKNVPAEFRDQQIAQAKALIDMFGGRRGNETDEQFALRSLGVKQLFDQLTTLAKELDEILIGWAIDNSGGGTYLDIEVTAKPGTKTAQEFATMKEAKTNFAGFLLPGAAVTAVSSGTISDADAAQVKGYLETMRKTATKDIADNADLTDQQRKLAQQLIADAMDVLQKTIDAKKSDGGMAVVLEPGAPAIVVGAAVAETAKLEKVLKQLAAEAKKEQPALGDLIKLDADSQSGVKLHMATVPIPDPNAAPIIGDSVQIVVGIGEDSVYIGAGKKAMDTLKKVIEKSKAEAGKSVPPVQVTVAGLPIAKFVAAVAPDEDAKQMAQQAAAVMEQSAGKDHVVLTAKPISNGVSLRLSVEEGLLKTIGKMAPGADGGKAKPRAKSTAPAKKADDDPFGS